MSINILIAGLGNPSSYALTRHSVGQLIVDSLASRLQVHLSHSRKFGGDFAQISQTVDGRTVSLTLVKPKGFMNLSGDPVSTALRSAHASLTSLIVLHDSLSHRPLTFSPKFGGSANGHNGVRSVIAAHGGQADFHRLRVGIGRNDGDAAEYVMRPLSPEERAYWGPKGAGTERVWKAIEDIVRKRIQNNP